jgi:hypothetical protein
MTLRLAVVLACAALGTGCVSHPLQRNTLKQMSTLSDLYEQQVLDNLAMFCANPDAVPSFAMPAGGTVTVQNQGSVLMVIQASGKTLFLDKSGPSAGGFRSVTGNWSMLPVNDPDRLRLMRCLYRQAIGCLPEGDCEHCREALEHYFGPDWATCVAPTGWVHAGGKRDVPRDACAVGCYRGTYVWVDEDGRAALTRFTLAILDVSTKLFVHPVPPSKEVTTFTYDNRDMLIRQEKRVVVDPVAVPGDKPLNEKELLGLRKLRPEDLPAAVRPTERLNYLDPYRGLFFGPR